MNEDYFYATMKDEERDGIGYVKGRDIDSDIDYDLRCEIEHSLYDISYNKDEIEKFMQFIQISPNKKAIIEAFSKTIKPKD